MDYCNYPIFEILKYKIELCECLEYSMETYELNQKEIERNIVYLKNNFESGVYKDIISKLFTSYGKVNKTLVIFFQTYSSKKIIRMISSTKASKKLKYIKHIIDISSNLNAIIDSFINEEEISNKLDKKIKTLIEISNNHFTHFLFFITFNIYANTLYPHKTKLKFKDKDMISLVSILKYANQGNTFDESINILEENDETKINNELEKLSNKCIELEKKQNTELKEIINLLNNELEKSKK